MRCQWGSTFENMHPWIVAHRYQEFDQLDYQIRKQYSYLASNLVALPKKVVNVIMILYFKYCPCLIFAQH